MILSEAERIQTELDDRIEEHGRIRLVVVSSFTALCSVCLTIGILAGLGMIAL